MRVTVEDVTDPRKAERIERDAQRRTDEDAAADRIRSYRNEQDRRWAALDVSVPCSHTIPGTCDYCRSES